MYRTCFWCSLGYILISIQICNSQQVEPFTFRGGNSENITIPEGKDQVIRCEAPGSVAVSWRYEGTQDLDALGRLGVFTSSSNGRGLLFFTEAKMNQGGTYVCEARNQVGVVITKQYRVVIGNTTPATSSSDSTNSGTYIGGISMTIVVVTLLVVWIFFEFFRKAKNGLTKDEIEEFLLGNIEAIQNNGYAHENAPHMPYNESYEIPDSKLYVDPKDILGSGAFGIVLKGRVNNRPVAVKTLRPGVEKTCLKSLLAELKIMIYLGTHENIVNLVGASTKKLGLGSVYIVVDCCDLGSLDKYIRSRQSEFVNQFDEFGKLTKRLGCSEMCSSDLVIWSAQIANGMAFMGTKNVIHGDLASRNVLLSDRHTVKITDFGLSRQLYDYTTNYKKQNMEPLPWRWMAYESLRELTFSCYSDIWSYGVTLWEIFTLGEVPYPGLAWTHEFVDGLLENRRLAKPRFASKEIYHQMLKCWNIDPKRRASFGSSKEFFNNVILCEVEKN